MNESSFLQSNTPLLLQEKLAGMLLVEYGLHFSQLVSCLYI